MAFQTAPQHRLLWQYQHLGLCPLRTEAAFSSTFVAVHGSGSIHVARLLCSTPSPILQRTQRLKKAGDVAAASSPGDEDVDPAEVDEV